MPAPCCCGISLQRGTQYVGIVDVIFGLLQCSVMAAHITGNMDEFDDDGEAESIRGHGHKRYTVTNLAWMPPELMIVILGCHVVQFGMGIILYIGATNKNRRVCHAYLILTAITAIFTGLLIRLYEMAVVYEYSRELKQEEEVTYFPGCQPEVGPQQPQPQRDLNSFPNQQNYSPYEHNAGAGMHVPEVHQPGPYPLLNNIKFYGHNQYGQRPTAPPPPPPALQPPPLYEAALNEPQFQPAFGNRTIHDYYPPVTSMVATEKPAFH